MVAHYKCLLIKFYLSHCLYTRITPKDYEIFNSHTYIDRSRIKVHDLIYLTLFL